MSGVEIKRDLNTVENEIITLRNQAQQQALIYAVEIGRRLTEAKSLVPHGGWADWLENKVEFKQRTANNFMKIYEEYGNGQLNLFSDNSNSQPVANLNYTQLVMLLALPKDERDSFVEENDVENMTKRELEKAVKERKEAIERAEAAELKAEQYEIEKAKAHRCEQEAAISSQKVKELKQQLDEIKVKYEKAQSSEKEAKDKLKKLKENPEIPQEIIDKANAEAQAKLSEQVAKELKNKTEEINNQLSEMKKEYESATLEAQKAKERISELEKKIKLQNPNVENFKRLFEQAQNDIKSLFNAISKIQDEEPHLAESFKAATSALLKKFMQEAEQ